MAPVQERVETLDRDRPEGHAPSTRRPAGAPPAPARTSRDTGFGGSAPPRFGAGSRSRSPTGPRRRPPCTRCRRTRGRHAPSVSLGREHRVEGRDPIGLGGRDGEPFARVAEAAGLIHPDASLQGVQRRQQQMTSISALASASASDAALELDRALAPRPARRRGAEDGVHGSAFVVAGQRVGQDEIHAVLGPHRFGDLLDPDGTRLELRGPGLRIGRVDRQDVGVDLIGEVQGHEHEPGAKAAVDPHRDIERPAT